MIADPKSYCAAHHLYQEHDDSEVPLLCGAEHFQHQINYGHVVALNQIIIALLASLHLLKFQQLRYLQNEVS